MLGEGPGRLFVEVVDLGSFFKLSVSFNAYFSFFGPALRVLISLLLF